MSGTAARSCAGSASPIRAERCSVRCRWPRTSRCPSRSIRSSRRRRSPGPSKRSSGSSIWPDSATTCRPNSRAAWPKRAGLARALALNPKLLFFDEPSAGLDPITSAELDRLLLRLRDQFGSTIVVVTHELDSVFTIADRVIMLDKETKSIVADGPPYFCATLLRTKKCARS